MHLYCCMRRHLRHLSWHPQLSLPARRSAAQQTLPHSRHHFPVWVPLPSCILSKQQYRAEYPSRSGSATRSDARREGRAGHSGPGQGRIADPAQTRPARRRSARRGLLGLVTEPSPVRRSDRRQTTGAWERRSHEPERRESRRCTRQGWRHQGCHGEPGSSDTFLITHSFRKI